MQVSKPPGKTRLTATALLLCLSYVSYHPPVPFRLRFPGIANSRQLLYWIAPSKCVRVTLAVHFSPRRRLEKARLRGPDSIRDSEVVGCPSPTEKQGIGDGRSGMGLTDALARTPDSIVTNAYNEAGDDGVTTVMTGFFDRRLDNEAHVFLRYDFDTTVCCW